MDRNKYDTIRLKMERTAEALKRNGFLCECAENIEEALEIMREWLNDGDIIGVGGSMTLFETGAIDALRDGPYTFLDRYAPGLSPEQINALYRECFSADAYVTGTNAVTEKGELYNVDGNGNRVAAMIFGPASVIVIAGYNKIVRDLDEAKIRVEEIAAPANNLRLHTGNPCTTVGKCVHCNADNRICADTVVMGRQRNKGRVKVILVGEELGY